MGRLLAFRGPDPATHFGSVSSSPARTVTRSVPFFNYPALFAEREAEYMAEIRRVLAGGRYILQGELRDFEAGLESFTGIRHVVGVANGTDALLLALKAAGLGPGDEVILPSHTFVATASAVHHAGCTPVLVDVGDDHMMDPGSARRAVTGRTRAVMPVQLNGRVCDMDAVAALAKEYGLLLVEDAAQALGARFRGTAAGGFGVAAGLSFYPAKLLGCFGDGGAVLTNDDAVADRLRWLRDHGRTDGPEVAGWAYNSRLDNVQAAILHLKLRSFEADVTRRREIARRYHEAFLDLPDVLLPPPPDDHGPHFDVFQNYEMEVGRRDELRAWLSERGIGTIIQWGGKAVHQFEALGLGRSLPVTERVMARSLLLPMNTALTDDDVSYVCDQVRAFHR